MTRAQGTRNSPPPASGRQRCAIYTRKSTEEGLEQEFNSLDAQRESGEADIASQQHEGWICLAEHYDDGGFTGGNMDRPALRRLLADTQAGKVDCVVVYKVDRLSRSLLDFARMMESFEQHQVAFVSVAQQFNTSTSMGRLVLNVLLSFAQFEREIISERTRDKIAAARRKGRWAGGMPLLGYDVDPHGSKLVVNEEEAARVRAIFQLYLEQMSLLAVVKELDRRGWRTKQWLSRRGHPRGGKPFVRQSLHKLLTNVTYLGQVRHRNEAYHGEHTAIIEADVWQRVQAQLQRGGRAGGQAVRNQFGALLKGLLRPIEQILEVHLGLGLAICNLRETLGLADALNVLCVESREVLVDEQSIRSNIRNSKAATGSRWPTKSATGNCIATSTCRPATGQPARDSAPPSAVSNARRTTLRPACSCRGGWCGAGDANSRSFSRFRSAGCGTGGRSCWRKPSSAGGSCPPSGRRKTT